jgi:hypothetical protein
MLDVPFLTDLDSRAAVKGSRDPLGIQALWTRLGRHVVGNLTTVSSSVRDFTTLLIGYHLAGQLADGLGPGSELATFLKWEQLAAYARAAVNRDYAFRGTDRVRKSLCEGSRVTLSAELAFQILSNQKIYGLWGLYTGPARASGLVDGNPSRLTLPAKEHLDRVCLPILAAGAASQAKRLLDTLRPKAIRIDIVNGDARLVGAVANALRPRLLPAEREFYRQYLLHGGPNDSTDGRQRQLANLFVDVGADKNFKLSPASVAALTKAAKARGETWHPLAHRLDRIRTAESVFAPVAGLFTHMLGLDGKPCGTLARRLKSEWGSGLRTINSDSFRELQGEIGAGDTQAGARWVAIAEGLARGQYDALVDLLIDQNKSVMQLRGGAPWIDKQDGRLQVRFREEQGDLPARDELLQMWRFPYFLDSLLNVTLALKDD